MNIRSINQSIMLDCSVADVAFFPQTVSKESLVDVVESVQSAAPVRPFRRKVGQMGLFCLFFSFVEV